VIELAFPCMGTTVRLIAPPEAPLESVRDGIEALAARLTRFTQPTSWARTRDSTSELCALNADPRRVVPASPALRRAVAAALLAARRTGGLADPTLLGAVEAAGYRRSRVGVEPASLAAALWAAPPRRPASPGTAWRDVRVDEDAGTVTRPPGVRLDLGGSAKGLAADWAAGRLAPYGRFAVDCGGDVRLGGAHEVRVRGTAETLQISDGAVATSGLARRIWRLPDGTFAHHLIDPATGTPAWTGLVAATALAPTALEAEALAKAALLSGPDGARRVLSAGGGVLVHDDGHAERVGDAQRVRVRAERGVEIAVVPVLGAALAGRRVGAAS
jgi:thiamine biosynthesis lipoprotein